MKQLTKDQKSYLENYFDEQIFPVLTPMAIDAYRPFPMLLNKRSFYRGFTIESNQDLDNKQQLAIDTGSSVLGRFIEVPFIDGTNSFVLLEDVISFYIVVSSLRVIKWFQSLDSYLLEMLT